MNAMDADDRGAAVPIAAFNALYDVERGLSGREGPVCRRCLGNSVGRLLSGAL